MAEINVNGRMLVKNFKKQFQEAFGCSLRVYVKTHFADDEQTLASLREEGKKGGELSVKGNMLVGNFEAKMLEEYGITVQVANIDDTKLVDNSLTLAAAGRGEERKAVKKTEKVASTKQQGGKNNSQGNGYSKETDNGNGGEIWSDLDAKKYAEDVINRYKNSGGKLGDFLEKCRNSIKDISKEAESTKLTAVEQPQADQPTEGEKKQFKVVLTGKAICNVPVSSHDDCNETTLDGNSYFASEIWEGIYGANPLAYCGIDDGAIYDGGAMSMNIKHVQIGEGLPEGVEYNSDATFKIGECDSIEEPCTDEDYVAILECNITCTISVELADAADFDLSKLDFTYDGDNYYDGKPIDTDFAFEVTKLIGYTDGEKEYEHCYEAPVTLKELVDKYQGARIEVRLLVDRTLGEVSFGEAREIYDNNCWDYEIDGYQLVNTWTSDRFDINNLDKPCLKEEMADKLVSSNFDLDFWGNHEDGYDLEVCAYETDEDGDYVDGICRCFLMEAWL